MRLRSSKQELRKATLLALVLPKQEREGIERQHGINPAFRSLVLGVLELVFGILAYVGFGAFHLSRYGGGFVGWFLWHTNPVTWLTFLVFVTGIFRIANYFVNHEPIGEPLVWFFLRVHQFCNSYRSHRDRMHQLGPERSDRAIVEEGSDLVILASREKERWDEYATVKVEDRFYTIERKEERLAGPWTDIAYVLKELPETEVIRGLVHTDARLPPTAP